MPPCADTFEERPSHEQSASRVPQKKQNIKKIVSSFRGLQKTLSLTLKVAAECHVSLNKGKRPLISRQRKKKRESASAGGRNKSVIEVET